MAEKLTIKEEEAKLSKQFARIDDVAFINQKKVVEAFKKARVTPQYFSGSTGYGYDDLGRDNLAKIYAEVFGGEKAIVSPLLTSGTHAITTVLYGLLRRGDMMLSISGIPYDTIQESIFGQGNSSLEDYGVNYSQIDLKEDGNFDCEAILKRVAEEQPKMVYVQRSRGYSTRKAISPYDMQPVFEKVKQLSPNTFIVVDNCYGEFVDIIEPTNVGADVIVGSLIKNAGGGLAPTGGYIVGSEKAIDLIATRYTNPSLLLELGSYEMGYRMFFQGFFMAPHIVAQSLKGSLLVGQVMQDKGYKIVPNNDDIPQDIVKSVVFENADDLIKFVQTVQTISPVDSHVLPMPWDMPGYKDQVIMAAGTFVGGASIELSCDGPIRPPYIAYFQGGLTYEHVKMFAEKLIDLY
ncbi:MAG: methionine gamma-lyase family protein [Clostridia bacterium]|nr:methionine gamma-lyase family protein [Clostridia bacterium]